MKEKTRSTVMPTTIDEVELKGEGGLKKAFLLRTILTIVVLGIVFLCASIAIYTRALQKEMQGDLKHVSMMILTYYEDMYPGEYNLLIDEAQERAYLKKGDAVISEDTSFVEHVAGETGTEISLFFYDTRMISTINDSDGNAATNTIANNKISSEVLIGGREYFFNDVTIEKVRYCVQYTPIFTKDNTCIGMIGVGRPFSETLGYVYRLSAVYGAIIIVAGLLAALWMTGYTSKLVKHLDKLKDFMGSMASGRLDGNLDQSVLNREDEVGDMGRCALFVRGSLKKLVERDPLTNLNNRRSGNLKLEQIRRAADKYGQVYCIAMGDIDFFKKVNDTYGHDAGDAVLKEVARILSDRMAGKGTVVRWGGEEFLFIIEDMKLEEAKAHMWNILREIRAASIDYGAQTIRFTMSYGLVEGDPNKSADAEITVADELLYFAKESGRNRVITYIGEVPDAADLAPAVNAAELAAGKNAAEPASGMNAKPAEPTAEKADELWDIYDANKELTGRTMKRNDFTMKDGDYHLTVLGVVMKPTGEFLVTRRVMSKSWAPGWWEVSGGAAIAGEKSYDAVVREIREETGLDVSGAEGGYMFSYKRDNPDEGDNYFVDVYRFVMDFDDDQVKIQREEADGYMLAKASDIAELGADGVFLHYDSIKEVFNT
ncbi:diguanylate cyclase (GGDEF) domain-containing protein [Lachnospiraceae bacterium XBB2008]|nr:diguanylate cyclase (GGDEF) domain-containing protein [Lachnospiraceae bacterium XBB2008]